jgi:hypothetical protein
MPSISSRRGGRSALAIVGTLVTSAGMFAYAGCASLDAVLVDAGSSEGGCPQPRPPEGLYTYATTQNIPAMETLTLGDAAPLPLDLGSTFKASVRYSSSGYVFRLQLGLQDLVALYLTVGPGGVSMAKYDETVFGDLTTQSCSTPITWIPCPAPSTGAMPFAIACTGENGAFEAGYDVVGTHRFLGTELVLVGNSSVAAVHFHDERNIAGKNSNGTQTIDWWFRSTDGLLLEENIGTQAMSPTPKGTASYVEQVGFTLQSLTPAALPPDGGPL